MLVVDDYGHHPTELAATLAAARLYGRRLVVAFQPHRYTRTRDLLREFAPALAGADELLLTDIYAAGEAPIAGVDAAALLATFPAGAPRATSPRDRLAAALAEAGAPRRPGAVPGRGRHHRRADGAAARCSEAKSPVVSAPRRDRRRAARPSSSIGPRRSRGWFRRRRNRRVPFARPSVPVLARRGRGAGSGASWWSPARCWSVIGVVAAVACWRAGSWSAT